MESATTSSNFISDAKGERVDVWHETPDSGTHNTEWCRFAAHCWVCCVLWALSSADMLATKGVSRHCLSAADANAECCEPTLFVPTTDAKAECCEPCTKRSIREVDEVDFEIVYH